MAVSVTLGLGAPASLAEGTQAPPPARAPVVVTEKARELHGRSLVVDGHNDLPWEIRQIGGLDQPAADLTKLQPALHSDLVKLRAGGLGAQFWSAWAPADTTARESYVAVTLEQIDLIQRMVQRYPNDLMLATSVADIRSAHAKGKIASLIGVEGGHSIDHSLGTLRKFHEMGVRYLTLTHADSLDWADSATDVSKSGGGLSPFGREVVREMNSLGMLVDISHVSDQTMNDVLEVSKAPVIFSHSSARGVADHPRNVPDAVLHRLRDTGGVVMVNFFSAFLVQESADIYSVQLEIKRRLDGAEEARALAKIRAERPMPRGTIHTLLDHIDHIVREAGIDHVGLGSDFDGVSVLPEQLEDTRCYLNITQGLLDRGYSDTEVQKVLGENLLRVFAEVERVAADRP